MNLSDLIDFIPVVGQFKTGYEEGKAEKQKQRLIDQIKIKNALEEMKNKYAPIGNYYGVPSEKEEDLNRSNIEANKAKWQEVRSKFIGPLTQEDQSTEPKPFYSKRQEFMRDYGVSPDINMEQYKDLSTAKENLAKAKYYETGGKQTSGKMAVADKYVSQQFLDSHFPELAGQDIPIEELKQRLINMREENRRNALVPVYSQGDALEKGSVPKGSIIQKTAEDQPLSSESTSKLSLSGEAVSNINTMLDILKRRPDIYQKTGIKDELARLASIGDEDAQRYLYAKKNAGDVLEKYRSGKASTNFEKELYSNFLADFTRTGQVNKDILTQIGKQFEKNQEDILAGSRKDLKVTRLNGSKNLNDANTETNKQNGKIMIDKNGKKAIVYPDGSYKEIR